MWTYKKIYNKPYVINGIPYDFEPTLKVPVFEGDPDYGKTLKQILNLTDGQVEEIILEAKWNQIREIRDNELKNSDWTQGADVPNAIKQPWAVYRNALRNLPQQGVAPEDLDWPTKPE